MYALWVFGLSRNIGDKGTLGGRWGAKLHIIKHHQNWTLGTYKIFYSVTIFVIVSSLSDDKHLLFLFFWRSVPFVLVRGVFLSTKIARNTPNSMKENLLLFLLHHATKCFKNIDQIYCTTNRTTLTVNWTADATVQKDVKRFTTKVGESSQIDRQFHRTL